MKTFRTILIAFALLGGFISACGDEQDFDQYDNISITPTVEGSMLYVETPERIINEVPTATYFSQDFNFDAFNQTYFAERVIDGVITYEVENTTSKPLDIVVEFLDAAGTVLDTESFTVNAAPTSILHREIAYGSATGRSIDIIRNTSSIRVSAQNLGDNTSTSGLPDPKVILRSSGKFRVRIK